MVNMKKFINATLTNLHTMQDNDMQPDYDYAINCLRAGGIIAYPTEGVYGLGCDPFNETAVNRVLSLKQRSSQQGLILIAAAWSDIAHLIQPLSPEQLAQAFTPHAEPITWIFPASDKTPPWIHGQHHTIALRLTTHPEAKTLCQQYGQALVSTSANIHGQPTLTHSAAIQQQWHNAIDYILPGRVGGLNKPSQIRDIITGEILRP
jgi:L-threonylcarbamoyladenylate synthase